jgi:hypothetical protein
MSTEDVNGWKNRETWQANLWISNDENLYHLVLHRSDHLVTDRPEAPFDADDFRDVIEDYLSGTTRYGLLGDIIGLWLDRVDWDTLAATWIESAA